MMISILLLSATLAAAGQSAVTSSVDTPRPYQSGEYELGPGDVVSISVSGQREFEQSVRVSNSGRIHVPFVGVMFVGGMTALDLERQIASQIKAHELINEPSVRVNIERRQARPVYVIGEVNAPGQFVIMSEMFLLDLITKAGGLLPSADEKLMLYRRNSLRPDIQTRILPVGTAGETSAPAPSAPPPAGPAPGDEVIAIDVEALRTGSKPELNVRLRGGDVVYVGRRQPQTFYVIGDVITPGAYGLPRRGQVTAAQALTYAGGPLPTAGTGKAFIMRHDEAGAQIAIPFDFAAIIQGKEADIQIRPNDILFVPNSGVKTIGIGLLNLVPRLLQQFLIF